MSFIFINLTSSEKRAIAAVDEKQLWELISAAVDNKSLAGLYNLRLEECGEYVAEEYRDFRTAIERYKEAKASKKLEWAARDAHVAGSELSTAVRLMKERMVQEEKESEFFRIDDLIHPPHNFSNKLHVRVSFRWRKSVDEEWNFGSIEYRYDYVERVDYLAPRPARKPSARQVEERLQAKLNEVWVHMRDMGLISVRDYFRAGGDGSEIPESFTFKVPSGGYPNTSEADFWDRKANRPS